MSVNYENPYKIEVSPNTKYRVGTKILVDFARDHGLDLAPKKRLPVAGLPFTQSEKECHLTTMLDEDKFEADFEIKKGQTLADASQAYMEAQIKLKNLFMWNLPGDENP